MTPKKIYKIGRDHHNDIVIPGGYEKTSRWHCEIEQFNDGSCQIIDISTNGTFVNGTQIPKNVKIPLSPNDTVKLADQYVLDLGFIKKPGFNIAWMNVAAIFVSIAAVGSLVYWLVLVPAGGKCDKSLQAVVDEHSKNIGLVAHAFYYKTFTHNNTPVFAGYDKEHYETTNELKTIFNFNYNKLLPFYVSGTGFLINVHKDGPLLVTNRHIGNPAFEFNNGKLQDSEGGRLMKELSDELYKFERDYFDQQAPNINREYGVQTYSLKFIPNGEGFTLQENMSYSQLIEQMGISNAQLQRYSNDEMVDIAILGINGYSGKEKELLQIDRDFNFEPEEIMVGDVCYMLGFGGGIGLMDMVNQKVEFTALSGPISKQPKYHVLDYDIETEGGSSGSPVFDQCGNVIAIHFAGRKTIGYGIPIFHLRDVLNYVNTKIANN